MITTTLNKASSTQRYDSFGMLLVGRNWEGGSGYRYGFSTQEQDDEVYGKGNLNTAKFWEYDTRLGRRWNIDPKTFVSISSYTVYKNNPIIYNDLNGDIIQIQGSNTDETFVWEPGKVYGGSNTFIIQTVASLELLTHTTGVGDVKYVDDLGADLVGNVILDFVGNGRYKDEVVEIWDATAVFESGDKAHTKCDCNPEGFYNEKVEGNKIYFNAYEGLNVQPGPGQVGGLQAPFMGLLHEFGHRWTYETAPIKTEIIKEAGWGGKGLNGKGHEYWILDKVENVAARIFTAAGNAQAERIWYRPTRWNDEPKQAASAGTTDISYHTDSSTSKAIGK